jgi:DNA polymerase IV
VATRTILHVDMDAFYVSVEIRRRPELRGKPVVVGGTASRGVVAAASYEARRYGVFSAMPSAQARRRCPQAVFLPGDHELYSQVSTEVHEIFRRFTPLIEPLALDEAFLDVSGSRRIHGDGVTIAAQIRMLVQDELQLSCSVGVAPNKFLAKLASVAAKPQALPSGVLPGHGVVEVLPGDELAFLHPLPVKALWGVGPATLERLAKYGLGTVGDLARLGQQTLASALGPAAGGQLYRLANAIDDRPVEPERSAKSIGNEETYPQDLHDRDELNRQLVRLSESVASRLRANGLAARTLTLKVRFAGFRTITRSTTNPVPLTTGQAIAQVIKTLFEQIDTTPGVRLLGVTGSHFEQQSEQLNLLDLTPRQRQTDSSVAASTETHWRKATGALDEIRSRFGAEAIGPASTMDGGKLRPVRTGGQAWGPDSVDLPRVVRADNS